MRKAQTARLLRIHVLESDRYAGKPLYEAIVAVCREHKIAGATVFLGLEGYGETAEIHRGHLLGSDRPVLITIVDVAENLARLTPVVESMIRTGIIATSEVEMIRVESADADRPEGLSH